MYRSCHRSDKELYINRDQRQTCIELEIESPWLFSFIQGFFTLTAMKSGMMSDTGMVINRENPVFITSCGIYFDKRNVDFNIFCKYVSAFENARFAPKTKGSKPLGDFLSIDLPGGYTLKGKVPVRFYFRISNLTDEIYSTFVGYPDFDRTFCLGMRFSFIKNKSIKD